MLSYDARWYHRAAKRSIFGVSSSSRFNSWVPIPNVFAALVLLTAFCCAIEVLFTGPPVTSTAGDVLLFGFIGLTLLMLGEGTWQLAHRKEISGYHRRDATEIYDRLLSHNKSLAKPLMKSIYVLDGGREAGKRIDLLREIDEKDKWERKSRRLAVVDDTDIEQVRFVLDEFKSKDGTRWELT